MLFSCHHAYLIDVFGMASFGTLNGISSFLAAMIVFSSYPLQLFALRTNYAMSFVPIGVLILMSMFIPFILWKQYKKRAAVQQLLELDSTLNLNGDAEQTIHVSQYTKTITRKDDSIINWAETFSVDPQIFRYPESIEEVISLVNSNSKIRCAGALHSCAPLIASEGIIMSLTKQYDCPMPIWC